MLLRRAWVKACLYMPLGSRHALNLQGPSNYLTDRLFISLHLHLYRVDGFGCCDEQGLPVFASKANIGRPGLIDRNVGNLFALWVKHRHALSRQVQVSL